MPDVRIYAHDRIAPQYLLTKRRTTLRYHRAILKNLRCNANQSLDTQFLEIIKIFRDYRNKICLLGKELI